MADASAFNSTVPSEDSSVVPSDDVPESVPVVTEWKVITEGHTETPFYRLDVSLSAPFKDGVRSEGVYSLLFRRWSVLLDKRATELKQKFKWCNWLSLKREEITWLLETIVSKGGEAETRKEFCEDSDVVYRSLTVDDFYQYQHRYIKLSLKRMNVERESKVLIPWKERSFVLQWLRIARKAIEDAEIANTEM